MSQLAKQNLIERLEKMDFFGHPSFYELLGNMAELHSQKNHDYAGRDDPFRNFHKAREQGVEPWRGVLVRLSDKWSRLESFCKHNTVQVKSESFEDTLLDNAVYSLIAIILYRDATCGDEFTLQSGLPRVPAIKDLVDRKEAAAEAPHCASHNHYSDTCTHCRVLQEMKELSDKRKDSPDDTLVCKCGWSGTVYDQDALGTKCGCCPQCGNESLD